MSNVSQQDVRSASSVNLALGRRAIEFYFWHVQTYTGARNYILTWRVWIIDTDRGFLRLFKGIPVYLWCESSDLLRCTKI